MFWVLLLGLLAGIVAVSGESYWIDEASTVDKAIQPTVSEWWERLRWEGTSNLQLPLYLFYAWGWEKLFGSGEWVTRAANVPWFVLGLVAYSWSFVGLSRLRIVALLSLWSSAFVWYYVNEARPYAMQFGAACVVFGSLVQLSQTSGDEVLPRGNERRWVLTLGLGSVVLSASGMLAMLWLGGGLGAALFAYPWSRTKRLLLNYRPVWLATAGMLLAVGLYYLWTLTLGARATVIASTDLKSLLFTAYEMLGLLGLGPSRLALRSRSFEVFAPYLAGLFCYGVLLAILWGLGWRRLREVCSRRTVFLVLVGCGSVMALLIAVGVTSRFRLLGRHCMPLIPVLLFPLGLGLASAWERRGWLGKFAAIGFVLLGLASCLILRFDSRHAKDDYRGAANLARAALQKGDKVWWNADQQAALFYGVPLARPPAESGKAIWIQPFGTGFERGLDMPDLVLTSKPDVYDTGAYLSDFLTRSGYRPVKTLTAFTVWRRTRD